MSDRPTIDSVRRQILLERSHRESAYSDDLLEWTITSLSLINGGALVALVGNDETRHLMLAGPGWLFGLGVMSSLLAGISVAVYYSSAAGHLLQRAWSGDELTEDRFMSVYMGARAWLSVLLTCLFGIASFACFVLGCWEVSKAPWQIAPATVASR